MTNQRSRPMIRMLVLAVGAFFVLEAGVALALPKAALCPCDTWECGTGISGGGTIATDAGTASFSIFAMQIPPPSDAFEAADVGRVHWTAVNADGTTITLNSVEVDDYGWTGDKESGIRWLRGMVVVNGQNQVAFFLRAVDNGPPEAATDTVELFVGSAIEGAVDQGFGYHAAGPLASGDFQIMDDMPLETMAPDGA